MSRPFTPKVVTANDLLMGDVVYLTEANEWSPALADAVVLREADKAEEQLNLAAQRAGEVVGVYLADVRVTDNGPEPVHFREDFRRTGPSNYDHGKQAELRA
ncbi:MAG: DUF2849 domain-containing protein [Arenibacterium sp.]